MMNPSLGLVAIHPWPSPIFSGESSQFRWFNSIEAPVPKPCDPQVLLPNAVQRRVSARPVPLPPAGTKGQNYMSGANKNLALNSELPKICQKQLGWRAFHSQIWRKSSQMIRITLGCFSLPCLVSTHFFCGNVT